MKGNIFIVAFFSAICYLCELITWLIYDIDSSKLESLVRVVRLDIVKVIILNNL